MAVIKPSELIRAVLTGRLPLDQAPEAIQSACQFEFYQGAVAVLAADTKPKRRAKLDKIPATVRPHVEAEAKRIWLFRKDSY